MQIKVHSAGVLTTIQDLGRPGYYHLGIPMGGAMDRYALRCANMLVGNDEGAACLEATFIGPDIEFAEDTVVAVCGADLPPKLNGEEQPTWAAFAVKSGDRLSFDFLRSGARAIIAIGGGITTPPALDSRSTYAIGALGGIDGRAIMDGDTIPLGKSHGTAHNKSVPKELRRGYGIGVDTGEVKLRMISGLYWHRITKESQQSFVADTWKVAMEADRMGYRFQGGNAVKFVEREQPFGAGSDPSNITDACYPYGSIQIPSGTEPIILHRDAVSGGGYFMVGTIISADMDVIGQLQPGTSVKFTEVTMEDALKARAERQQGLAKLREFINAN